MSPDKTTERAGNKKEGPVVTINVILDRRRGVEEGGEVIPLRPPLEVSKDRSGRSKDGSGNTPLNSVLWGPLPRQEGMKNQQKLTLGTV